MNNLTVTSSPHIRSNASTFKIMLDVVIAMVPLLAASAFIFGVRALWLAFASVFFCVFFEYLFDLVTGKSGTVSNLSAVVTGLLLAFNLPVTAPVWVVLIGAFIAIVIVKCLFGGLGKNFANPAATARVVLMLSFGSILAARTIPVWQNGGIDVISGATPLQAAAADPIPSLLNLFLGIRGGALGETCVAAILLGAIYLVIKRVINPITPIVFIGTAALMAWAFGLDPLRQIMTGSIFLGACFMATDYATTPLTVWGKAVFAAGCGILTMIIRQYSIFPEGVAFAILLMNIATPLIDRVCARRPFGSLRRTDSEAEKA